MATSSELIDGPAQDIDNYADGADAIEHFLALMRSRAESLPDYRAVAAIRDLCWCGRTLGGRPTRVEHQRS